jgi:hypothetical protein
MSATTGLVEARKTDPAVAGEKLSTQIGRLSLQLNLRRELAAVTGIILRYTSVTFDPSESVLACFVPCFQSFSSNLCEKRGDAQAPDFSVAKF